MVALSPAEQRVFGSEAYYHPVTGGIVEVGSGAFPVWRQALTHCDAIEAAHGKARADECRRQLLPDLPERVREQVKAAIGE